jgi:hypothetical protein
VLELPPGYAVLHATIDELPAQLIALGDNRWRVALGPPELPQRLEIVFTGELSGSASQKKFEAPRLLDLQVDETLWTVYSPHSASAARGEAPAEAMSVAQQELHRLRSVTNLAQLPAEILGEHLPEEIARWYRPWRRRYLAARAALADALSSAGEAVAQSAEAIEAGALDAKISAVDARLGSSALKPQDALPRAVAADLLPIGGAAYRPARYLTKNASTALELRYSQAPTSGWSGRIVAAIGLVVLAAGAIVWLRKREVPQFAPAGIIIAVGVAWWLFLAPSALGLLLILVGAGTLLRAPGPRLARRRATATP